MKRALVCILIMAGLNAQASESPKIKVSGIIRSFDEKNVVLKQGDYMFRVPRNVFGKGIQAGQQITIELDRAVIFPNY